MGTFAERLDAAVGRQIKTELAKRGMDQKKLAEKMGIEPATLSRYVMNHRSMNMSMFLRLTEALDITPSVLLGNAQSTLASDLANKGEKAGVTPGENTQAAILQQIKAEMGARDWTQADLCAAAGVQTSTLSRYMAGTRDIPFPVLAELAQALGLTVVELIERSQRRTGKDQP